MSTIVRGQQVQLSSLQMGKQLGAGGFGRVFEVNNHPGLVYKQYLVSGADAGALEELIRVPATLPTAEADLLLSCSAWPLAAVYNGPALTGFVMPRVPQQFFGVTAAGPKLQELQYLLYPRKPLWGAIVPLDMQGRYTVVVKFIGLVAVLHRHKLVLGDISMNNLLWSAGQDPEIYLIDCDGTKPDGGRSPLPQPDTPDWNDPLCASRDADLDSDAYKLALVIGRVLACSADVRPGMQLHLPDQIPPRFAATAADYFLRAGGARASRPTALQWYQAITTGRVGIPVAPTVPPPPQPTLPLTPITGESKAPRGSIPLTPPTAPPKTPQPPAAPVPRQSMPLSPPTLRPPVPPASGPTPPAPPTPPRARGSMPLKPLPPPPAPTGEEPPTVAHQPPQP